MLQAWCRIRRPGGDGHWPPQREARATTERPSIGAYELVSRGRPGAETFGRTYCGQLCLRHFLLRESADDPRNGPRDSVTDRADEKGHDRDTAGTFVAEGEQDAENRANNCPPQADDVNDFGTRRRPVSTSMVSPRTPLREATCGRGHACAGGWRCLVRSGYQ